MRVCRHWHAVIIDNGCFWNHIAVRKRTEGLQLALSRSRQMQLHLKFRNLPTLARILPYIIPLRDRIRSLVLARGSRNEIMALSPLIAGVFHQQIVRPT